MLELDVGLTGILQAHNLLDNVHEALSPERLVDAAGAILLNRTRTRFQRQETPEGVPWPVSQSAKIRAAGGYTYSNGRKVTGGFTLFATGRLFHSIQLAYRGYGLRAIMTDVPYGPKHQKGEGRLPARVFLGFSAEDNQVVNSLVVARINMAKKGKGAG